jgi:N-acyl-D-aspartate/D-glutamate deacylase
LFVRAVGVLCVLVAVPHLPGLGGLGLARRVGRLNFTGRIRAEADAVLTILDALSISVRASFQEPGLEASGVKYVIVNGVVVVKDGKVQENIYPGGPIRAPF